MPGKKKGVKSEPAVKWVFNGYFGPDSAKPIKPVHPKQRISKRLALKLKKQQGDEIIKSTLDKKVLLCVSVKYNTSYWDKNFEYLLTESTKRHSEVILLIADAVHGEGGVELGIAWQKRNQETINNINASLTEKGKPPLTILTWNEVEEKFKAVFEASWQDKPELVDYLTQVNRDAFNFRYNELRKSKHEITEFEQLVARMPDSDKQHWHKTIAKAIRARDPQLLKQLHSQGAAIEKVISREELFQSIQFVREEAYKTVLASYHLGEIAAILYAGELYESFRTAAKALFRSDVNMPYIKAVLPKQVIKKSEEKLTGKAVPQVAPAVVLPDKKVKVVFSDFFGTTSAKTNLEDSSTFKSDKPVAKSISTIIGDSVRPTTVRTLQIEQCGSPIFKQPAAASKTVKSSGEKEGKQEVDPTTTPMPTTAPPRMSG